MEFKIDDIKSWELNEAQMREVNYIFKGLKMSKSRKDYIDAPSKEHLISDIERRVLERAHKNFSIDVEFEKFNKEFNLGLSREEAFEKLKNALMSELNDKLEDINKQIKQLELEKNKINSQLGK